MGQARYYFLCALSGLIWSGIAYLLLASFDSGVLGWRMALRESWFFPGLWGGILVSPFIGLLIGLVHRPWLVDQALSNRRLVVFHNHQVGPFFWATMAAVSF